MFWKIVVTLTIIGLMIEGFAWTLTLLNAPSDAAVYAGAVLLLGTVFGGYQLLKVVWRKECEKLSEWSESPRS